MIGNVPKSVKESEFTLKIEDTCGKTSFEYLLEYTPKQPCYADLAKTTDTLTNWWFVVEFENPNALKSCVELNGTPYKDSVLRVRSLAHKEYDDMCGLLGIMKARTKQIKKNMKGKRLSIVLASNVSSRVTSDALYKFFSFPGDPIEVTMDRARKIALIAYDTEEQAVIALACDQAVLGPAIIRIELYRPDKHGKDLQMMLKVGRTGDISHSGVATGYIQISERGVSAAPESPAASRAPGAPPLYDPSRHQMPPPAAAPRPQARSLYPDMDRTAIVTNFASPAAAQHGHSAVSSPPKLPPKPASVSPSSHNPYANAYPQPASSKAAPHPIVKPAPYHPQAGAPQTPPRDWSSIVPTAKYTVTTEYK